MNKTIFSSLFALFLAAAACTQVTPVKGPDGQEWVAISCSHGAKNCWREAGEFCPLGYEVADEVQSSHGVLLFKHEKDEMLVRCAAPGTVTVAVAPYPAAVAGAPESAPRKE